MLKILPFLILLLVWVPNAFGQEPAAAGVGVADFYLARDEGGKAGPAATSFLTTDVPIYCVVQLDSTEPTTVRMNLVAVSVPGVKPDTEVVSTTYTTKDSQNRVNFSGRPTGRWVAGTYRADIYIGKSLAVSREFSVQKTLAPKPAAEGINQPKSGTRPRIPAKPPGS